MTRAGDLCLSSAGAVLAFATSGDGGYPAQHIIDGNPDTFWTTTGMFPQEFIISLNTLQKIGKITIDSSQIRSLLIETSTSKEPTNFEHCVEREFEHVEGQFHNEEITVYTVGGCWLHSSGEPQHGDPLFVRPENCFSCDLCNLEVCGSVSRDCWIRCDLESHSYE